MTHTASTPNESVQPAPSGTARRETLRGHMGTFELLCTALAFNAPLAILGGFVPVVIAFGNGLGAPLTFGGIAALVLLFAVGLNAMASRMVRPGAFYSYITKGLGRPPGLAAGCIAILTYVALGSGTYALFAMMVDEFFSTVLGMSSGPWWVWALAAWAVGSGLSLLNVEVSAKVLIVAMAVEIAVVVVWNLRVFWLGGPEGRVMNPFPEFFSGSVALAVLFAVLCMTGFESLQVFREETRDASRTVPRATYLEVGFLGILYSASAYAYVISEGKSNAVAAGAADPTGSVLASIDRYASWVVADAASLLLMTSSFAACLAIQNVAARYLYALGKDRVLPEQLGRVNREHGSPMVAAGVSGVLMLVLLVVPAVAGVDAVTTFTTETGVGAYCLIALWTATSVAVVFFFRRNSSDRVGVWSSTVAPTLSFLGLGAILVFATVRIADLFGGDAVLGRAALLVVAATALGGAVLALWWKSRDESVYRSIGSQEE